MYIPWYRSTVSWLGSSILGTVMGSPTARAKKGWKHETQESRIDQLLQLRTTQPPCNELGCGTQTFSERLAIRYIQAGL